MAQLASQGAKNDSAARASHRERAVNVYAARAAQRASKSRSKVPVLKAGGASLDASASEVALAAASADSEGILQVTITAATATLELEGRLSRAKQIQEL
jgi:hypothetical protein